MPVRSQTYAMAILGSCAMSTLTYGFGSSAFAMTGSNQPRTKGLAGGLVATAQNRAALPQGAPSAQDAGGASTRLFGLGLASAVLSVVAASSRRNGSASKRRLNKMACHAFDIRRGGQTSPQMVPVVDMEGKQIGEEKMQFYTLSKDTANYIVHQVVNVWLYQQQKFTAYVKRRSDTKKGRKPYAQKGSGKSRQGSRYSPLFGKSATNQAPHGLDNKRKKKNDPQRHYRSISTVLQSKWRAMKIVQGLEDGFPEARQYKLEQCVRDWTGVEPGTKSMLMITRQTYGEENLNKPEFRPTDNPLFMSGRLIKSLEMRRPRDIDPTSDGLFQCLKGRRLIVSREAFFDLKAKYDCKQGWAFKREREILVEQLQKITKDFPMDRLAELAAARDLPSDPDEREFWARRVRQEAELALSM